MEVGCLWWSARSGGGGVLSRAAAVRSGDVGVETGVGTGVGVCFAFDSHATNAMAIGGYNARRSCCRAATPLLRGALAPSVRVVGWRPGRVAFAHGTELPESSSDRCLHVGRPSSTKDGRLQRHVFVPVRLLLDGFAEILEGATGLERRAERTDDCMRAHAANSTDRPTEHRRCPTVWPTYRPSRRQTARRPGSPSVRPSDP